MTGDPSDDVARRSGDAPGATMRAARRSDARLDAAIADLAMDESLRLDEQSRAMVLAILDQAVDTIVEAVTAGASQSLGRSLPEAGDVLARLAASGLMQDRGLLHAVIDAARTALIEEALVAARAPGETPELFARLIDHADTHVRSYATAYLLAESGRRRGPVPAADLPIEVARRLAWSVAAVLAERAHGGAEETRAIAQAVRHHLSGADPERGVPAAAMHLAGVLGPAPNDRAPMLLDALGEGRLLFFAALAGQPAGVDVVDVRDAALDGDPTVLLTILRAGGVPRDDLARIGLRLADADRGRDVEALADIVDRIAGLSDEDAAREIAALTLDPEMRAAMRRLERRRR